MKKSIALFCGEIPCGLQAKLFDVSFDESMQYASVVESQNYLRNFCKQLYNEKNLLVSQDPPIIPKIVHLIWIGPLILLPFSMNV